jgi:hypothetical protein
MIIHAAVSDSLPAAALLGWDIPELMELIAERPAKPDQTKPALAVITRQQKEGGNVKKPQVRLAGLNQPLLITVGQVLQMTKNRVPLILLSQAQTNRRYDSPGAKSRIFGGIITSRLLCLPPAPKRSQPRNYRLFRRVMKLLKPLDE